MSRAVSGPAEDAHLRLTVPVRERLKAVVFDANAYGKARPDIEHLTRLAARLAGIGIETWVPEPVAWEWAEHVSRDWQALKNAGRQERDSMKRAGLETEVPRALYSSREAVIDTVLANLSTVPHVRIISLTGSSAAEALKDQVLQRSPAKLKGDSGKPGSAVKTGASDSAWLRDVLALASSEEILIVSSDTDVEAAFKAWGKQLPLIRKLKELPATLFDVTVDDGHAQSSIARYLLNQLPAVGFDGDGTSFDIGRIVGLETAITNETDGDGTSLSVYGASVTGLVALAGLDEVRIEHDVPDDVLSPENDYPGRSRPGELGPPKHDVAYAKVFFLAEGEATVQTLYNGGDPEVSVIPYDNILVRAQLSFRFTDGAITAVAAEADATAMLVRDAYDDDDDAVSALAEALACVPGLDLNLASVGYANADLTGLIRGIHGQVHVDVKRDSSAWRMKVAFWHRVQSGDELERDESVEVRCTYDPDSWWGGSREGFQGPNAYRVSAYGAGLPGSHGVWSVPAWVISRIDWSAFSAPKDQAQSGEKGDA
ncbi:hypothetical protein ACFW3D_28380 [Streptomyces sp. NPDC058864]